MMSSLWNVSKNQIQTFIELANNYHATIKFTAEISDIEIPFLDKFKKESKLDVRTHFKPTETFQYTRFSCCHPPGVRKGFIKGEALRLFRTISSKTKFEENITLFKQRLRNRGYPDNSLRSQFQRKHVGTTKQTKNAQKNILPFVTEYHPSVPNLKTILMSKWLLIENQPLQREIYKDPPLLLYRKDRSLKDILVRAKL